MDSAPAEELILWRNCLEITEQLLAKNMNFCFSLRVGSTFSFSLDTQKVRNDQHSELPRSKAKRSSPSNRRRNKIRLEAFLARKKANTVLSTSSPESKAGGQFLEGLGKPPNQTAPGDKDRSGTEINLPTTSTNGGNSEGGSSSHKDEIGVKEIKKRVQKCIDDSQRILEHQELIMRQSNEEKHRTASLEAWT